ncbi:MAG: TnpV protein [Oscillospiraceae bacterium]|nr:TnpV protein [Oscillospiraceae bacterium]
MKLTYHEGADGLMYPDLTIRGADTQRTLGKYGLMRRNFLRDKKPAVFQSMLIRVTLWETEDKADEMEERLMKQMAEQEGVTEALKAADQMEWVRRMNSIQNRAEEMVKADLIYQ